MAYNAKQLTLMNFGAASSTGRDNTSPVFMYRTTETLAQVLASNFFLSAYKRLTKGAIVHLVTSVGGTPVLTTCVVTTSSSASVVLTVNSGGQATGLRMAAGQHTTVAASDTVVTGLASVALVVAQLDDDPVDGAMHVTASIGDQAGAPAAGSILIKGWKSTDGDATLIAATTFNKKVNWIALGT